jgi:predicted TPR repeat methyltransferase
VASSSIGLLNRILVFTATYNEVENIAYLVDEVFATLPTCEVLVVDDASPDGTGRLLDELERNEPRLHVVHRPSKNGVGTAHKLAMKFALAHGYDALITMDADFSHHPKYLPQMLAELEQAEFVTGSRFVAGGSCEYPPSRRVLSRTASTLTRRLLGIPLHETTTSYRGFRRSLLERMNVDAIHSDGYSFFVESIFSIARLLRREHQAGGMREFPIRFEDRRAGATKISRREIWNGVITLARLSARRALRRANPGWPATEQPHAGVCNACGCAYYVEEYPATNAGHVSATYRCTSTNHASHGRLVKCLGCGLVYTNPQLAPHEMVGLYADVEDRTYLENVEARVRTFRYNLDAILQYLPARGRLLDVGSYCGIFLDVARDRGYDVVGVEPSRWASSYARDTYGVTSITGTLADVPCDAPFDIVCSWDVLEHLSNPARELALVNERLRTGGVFAFSTIDYKNWFPRLMGERWPWMMDMHLYYFDQKVVSQMLERAGFRLIHAQPYCHIITLDYFLGKLHALGVPGARVLRAAAQGRALRSTYVPFRFGDIRLFVCEKVRDVSAGEPATNGAAHPAATHGALTA